MLTQQTSQLIAPSGATQVPLLSPGQIRPGLILTGPAAQKIMVVREAQEDGLWLLEPLAPGRQHHAGPHTFAPATTSSVSVCGCGAARVTAADLIPISGPGGTARTYIIEPTSPPTPVDPFTVYVTAAGREMTLAAGKWPTPLPILPRMAVVWTVPAALRPLLVGGHGQAEQAEEE